MEANENWIPWTGCAPAKEAPATPAAEALQRGADRVEREGGLTLATFRGGVVELTQTTVGDYLTLRDYPNHPTVIYQKVVEADTPDTWVDLEETSYPLSALLRAHNEDPNETRAFTKQVRADFEAAGHDFDHFLQKAKDEAAERERKVRLSISDADVEAARKALGCGTEPVEAPKVETSKIQLSGGELRRLKAFLNSLPESFFADAFPVPGMGRLVSPAELIGNPQLGGPETFTAG